jgi:hypothetical protein
MCIVSYPDPEQIGVHGWKLAGSVMSLLYLCVHLFMTGVQPVGVVPYPSPTQCGGTGVAGSTDSGAMGQALLWCAAMFIACLK